jgi:hypothetical protein
VPCQGSHATHDRASDRGVLYTFNVSDFHRLHTQWIIAGREHAGMILAPQQRFSAGEQLRRILRLRSTTTAVSMRNRVVLLGNRRDDRRTSLDKRGAWPEV